VAADEDDFFGLLAARDLADDRAPSAIFRRTRIPFDRYEWRRSASFTARAAAGIFATPSA
jgi:hypothetical protein